MLKIGLKERIMRFFIMIQTFLLHKYKELQKSNSASAKVIIMFMVVVLIFTGVFGTIAWNLSQLGDNTSVAEIPGGAVMVSIIGLLGIIIIVMWAIKRAF